METNERTSLWSHPTQIEDILFKEVLKKLNARDIIELNASRVNKAWRALFTSNRLWKSLLQSEFPFIDTKNTTDFYNTFSEAVRSWNTFKCKHRTGDRSKAIRVCPCLPPTLSSEINCRYYHKTFTGHKDEYLFTIRDYNSGDKIFDCSCNQKIASKEYLTFPLMCEICTLEIDEDVRENHGTVEAKSKPGHAIWVHKEFNLAEEIQAAVAVPGSTQLVALTKSAPIRIILLNFNGGTVEQEELGLTLSLVHGSADTLAISDSGIYLAVYKYDGSKGCVYDLARREKKFELKRHTSVSCSFPLAFFTYENKEYLFSGSFSNRVNVYDLESGSLHIKEECHDDISFGSLHVSPDQKYILGTGQCFDDQYQLFNVLIENFMEGTMVGLHEGDVILETWNHSFTALPLCWISDTRVATWGDFATVPTKAEVPPFVQFLSANKNEKHEAEAVPLVRAPLIFDGKFMLNLNPNGVDVVDVNDSHVLFIRNQRAFSQMLCYNQHTQQVVAIKNNDAKVLVLSHIHYYEL